MHFLTKPIEYNTKLLNIIMQNENGPCPIIALSNVLLLMGNLRLPKATTNVHFNDIVEMVGNYLLTVDRGEDQGNVTQNLTDTLELLPTLYKGLDINIHFIRADSFEFTAALSMFDCCGVLLLHGWVVTPQDPSYELIARKLKSYNALVDIIVRSDAAGANHTHDPSMYDELFSQSAVCKEFLEINPTQLTLAGIDSLKDILPEDRPSVLFRNNHFYTIIKRGGLLYTMVTDQGYAKSPIVWESLDSISGSSTHYDCNFQLLDPELPTYRQSISEIDRVKNNVYYEHPSSSNGIQALDDDLLLAMELQDEEDMKHRDEIRRVKANSHLEQSPHSGLGSNNTSSSSLSSRRKNDDCRIL